MVICEVTRVEHMASPGRRLVSCEVFDLKLVVEILALVCKDQDVWLRRQVQAINCVVPDYRLDDLGKRQQEPLFEDRVTYLVRVFNRLVFRVLTNPLLLFKVDLW